MIKAAGLVGFLLCTGAAYYRLERRMRDLGGRMDDQAELADLVIRALSGRHLRAVESDEVA